MAKCCRQSQADVISVAMDTCVGIFEDDLIAMNTGTAMPPPCAFDLRCSNQVATNQNAHAFGLSSTVARMKMKTRPSHWLLP